MGITEQGSTIMFRDRKRNQNSNTMRKIIGQYAIATCLAFLMIGLLVGTVYMIVFQTELFACIILGTMVVIGLVYWITLIKEEIYGR